MHCNLEAQGLAKTWVIAANFMGLVPCKDVGHCCQLHGSRVAMKEAWQET